MTFHEWSDKNMPYIQEVLAFLGQPISPSPVVMNTNLAKTMSHLGSINTLMAEAAGYHREALANATAWVLGEDAYKSCSITQQKALADGRCSTERRVYDLLERASRTAVHQIEGYRTLISRSKAEEKYANYQGR